MNLDVVYSVGEWLNRTLVLGAGLSTQTCEGYRLMETSSLLCSVRNMD